MHSLRTFALLLTIVAFSSCAFWQPSPSGALLFSYRVTQGAFTGPAKTKTGTYYFLEEPTSVTGYRYKNGKLLDTRSGGSLDSENLLRRIRAIGFETFDYELEAREIEQRIAEQSRNGTPPSDRILTLDGYDYEIKFTLDRIDFTMKRANPRYEIEFYARYSPKMAKLSALIHAFEEYYGKPVFESSR